MKRMAEELAQEAAECIETNALTGEELVAYLAAWISDCAVGGDLDAMRRGHVRAARRLDRALRGPT